MGGACEFDLADLFFESITGPALAFGSGRDVRTGWGVSVARVVEGTRASDELSS